MMGPTLVTGAGGFAGGHLIDQLAADSVETIGWYRPGGHEPAGPAGVRWQAVDLLDRDAVRAAIRAIRPHVVFHCAGAAHVGQSWDTAAGTLEVNVLGTHHLVEAVREAAPEARVLVTSSALVYAPGDTPIDERAPVVPASPYGLSKLAQELAADNGEAPRPYIARPFNHFGPRQSPSFASAGFAKQIAEIEAGLAPADIRVGNLEARRDLTDVRDTVRAYRAIVEHGQPARPYNVCTGTAVAVRDVLDALMRRARVPIRVTVDPSRFRPNDTPVVLGDRTRLTTEIGWEPRIAFEQTIEDLLDFWRSAVRER